MNKRIVTRTLLALSAVALLSGFTRWGHHRAINPERVQRHMTERVDDFIDDVEADESQAAQIRAVASRITVQVPGVVRGHQALKESLHKAWASPKPERGALHSQLDAQLKTATGLLHDLLDAGLDVHDILTPEQRKEVGQH